MVIASSGTRASAHTHQTILSTPVDKERIQRAVREIVAVVGKDGERDGFRDTPRCIADMYEAIVVGNNVGGAD